MHNTHTRTRTCIVGQREEGGGERRSAKMMQAYIHFVHRSRATFTLEIDAHVHVHIAREEKRNKGTDTSKRQFSRDITMETRDALGRVWKKKRV